MVHGRIISVQHKASVSDDTSLLFQRKDEGMIKIMADNLDSCGLLMGHFVGILAGKLLEANPLFLETTVCLKKIYI